MKATLSTITINNNNRHEKIEFKGNTGAKSVTPCKVYIIILDYDWQKDNEKFRRLMISFKAMTKILYGISESLRKMRKKMASRHML